MENQSGQAGQASFEQMIADDVHRLVYQARQSQLPAGSGHAECLVVCALFAMAVVALIFLYEQFLNNVW